MIQFRNMRAKHRKRVNYVENGTQFFSQHNNSLLLIGLIDLFECMDIGYPRSNRNFKKRTIKTVM